MIVGLGVDVMEVARIQAVLERHGQNFLDHVFTSSEQTGAPRSMAGAAAYYAGRWSAKEAVSKALGTGIGQDCLWTDIEILREECGRPTVRLRGAGLASARRLGVERWVLSISHERNLACASVVAEGSTTINPGQQ